MSNEKLIALMVSIPRHYRDQLRTMAAEKNLKDPTIVTSAAQIAREIICEFLKNEERS